MDVSALVKKVTGGAQGNHGTLSTVMGMLGGQDQQGFSNLLSSLTSGGMGDQVKSWVGTGVNQLVSSQQVASLARQRQAATGSTGSGTEPERGRQSPG